MPAPFYPAVKGITTSAAGTGAFTPTGAATDDFYRAWSTVPAGWIGLVLFADGTAKERSYSYWDGSTLSRGTNQLFDSTTGSLLSLSSSATAAMVNDPAELMSHIGSPPWRAMQAIQGGTTTTNIGIGTVSTLGTGSSITLSNNSLLETQPGVILTSGSTAGSQAGFHINAGLGIYSTTTGFGGIEFNARWGATTLPASSRLMVGFATTAWGGLTTDPSANSASIMAFAKDAADTNIQLLTKNGTTANKVDTGIPWVQGGLYEGTVWQEPGTAKVWGLLIRLDTGAIWLGSTTTNLPANGSNMRPCVAGGISSTTPMVFRTTGFTIRYGY